MIKGSIPALVTPFKDGAVDFDALKRLVDANYPLEGASDHGVSQALYLSDPDGNGVELYWDRDPADWPRGPNGELAMDTRPLDLGALLQEAS